MQMNGVDVEKLKRFDTIGFLKDFLLKNIGINALSSLEIEGSKFCFAIRKKKMFIEMENMKAYSFGIQQTPYGIQSGYLSDSISDMLTENIRNRIEEYLEVKITW